MASNLFKTLCLPVTLYSAWKAVKLKNSAGGIDGLSVREFEENLKDNLGELRKELIDKTWNPEPYLRVEIEKNETETRKLGLLSVRDKIVQQAIKTLMEPKLENLFLKNSYGYRPGKGPVKAIRQVMHLFKQLKNGYAVKLDIDNYFDTINHERLFSRLQNFLGNEDIVRLVELCVKTGVVTKNMKWEDAVQGVPQGAVLSPLLANFYLHPFDQFVTSKTENYIRYADDFMLVSKTKEEASSLSGLIKKELEDEFHLRLNEPLVADFETGVEFLGISIRKSGLSLSEKKKKSLSERINSIEFKNNELSEKSLETLQGIKNYYAKLLPPPLVSELDRLLISKLHGLIKEHATSIRNKTTLGTSLKKIEFFSDETNLSKSVLIKEFVETYLNSKQKKKKSDGKADNKKLIRQKKQEYQKLESEGSELVVRTSGSFIGKSNKGIVIKVKGKVVNQKSTKGLKHITVTGQGVSLSSDAISYCIENKIPIDFFNSQGNHYASLLSPVSMDGMLWQQQSLLSIDKKVMLAGRIILSKLKNQFNLIKYYHKYHKDTLSGLPEKYVEVVLRIEKCISEVKLFNEPDPSYATFFMAQEAVAATAYWDYIRLLVDDDKVNFQKREKQGATDLFNSMLNYGYAILYARVWDAVLARKLNPSISVLHTFQANKPTLVYDIVELFRAQAVDRVVISLIQKGESLVMKNNLMNEPTKRLLIQNILERLNRYEKYRGEELRFIDIIGRQVDEFAAIISGESKLFKPYIAKW